jgi:hypothetical protein
VVDACGLPVRLLLTPGQASDKTTFPQLIEGLRLARHVVADRGLLRPHDHRAHRGRGSQRQSVHITREATLNAPQIVGENNVIF